jgi:DNA-directed RNA polymerase subunit RPC12/RpoP
MSAHKERIYEILELPLEDDEHSVINFVEWYRELYASRNTFCNWYTGSNQFWWIIGCNQVWISCNSSYHYNYCPYCGHKITKNKVQTWKDK